VQLFTHIYQLKLIPPTGLVNKIALARIKQDETKGSMKAKRKRAGWDSSFLAKLMP